MCFRLRPYDVLGIAKWTAPTVQIEKALQELVMNTCNVPINTFYMILGLINYISFYVSFPAF